MIATLAFNELNVLKYVISELSFCIRKILTVDQMILQNLKSQRSLITNEI